MHTQDVRLLQIRDHTLAVKAFNEHLAGTPLVFIHGITASVKFWTSGEQTPLVASQRWYSLSLPGHYPSAFPQGFKADQLTAELIADLSSEAILQLVGHEKVILIGHSTGGFTALATAARHPEQVKAAISISGFAKGYWNGVLRLLQLQARMGVIGHMLFKLNLRVLTSSLALYKTALQLYAADRQGLYHYPNLNMVLRDVFDYATQLDLDAMIAFFSRMPNIDITTWLSTISVPTFVLAGDKDPIVAPEQARLIARSVPNSTLHFIKGTGHLPMLERKDEYHQAFTDCLSSCL